MTIQPIFHDKQAKKIWYDLAYGKGKIGEVADRSIQKAEVGELSNFHSFISKDIKNISTLLLERIGIVDYHALTTIIFNYMSYGNISLEEATILMSDEKLNSQWVIDLISNDSIPIEILIENDYYAIKHIEDAGWSNNGILDVRIWNLKSRLKEVIKYLEQMNLGTNLNTLPNSFVFNLIGVKV
jgi:hypothetical protein